MNVPCQTHFLLNRSMYDQIDGIAMRSPLGPVLANLFMETYEQSSIDSCAESWPLSPIP